MQLYAEPTELAAQVTDLLASEAAPSSAALLQLALLCLQTGYPPQASRLRRSGHLSAEHLEELQSLERQMIRSASIAAGKRPATNGWQAALSPAALLRLGLLLSRCEEDAQSPCAATCRKSLGRGWRRLTGRWPCSCGTSSAAAAPIGAGRG
jgi:hypothetical protein